VDAGPLRPRHRSARAARAPPRATPPPATPPQLLLRWLATRHDARSQLAIRASTSSTGSSARESRASARPTRACPPTLSVQIEIVGHVRGLARIDFALAPPPLEPSPSWRSSIGSTNRWQLFAWNRQREGSACPKLFAMPNLKLILQPCYSSPPSPHCGAEGNVLNIMGMGA
jgi:hypothetical protein